MQLASFPIALAFAVALADAVMVRVCVPETGLGQCQDMLREPVFSNFSIECVSGPDRYGCIEKVASRAADTTAVTGEDVFLARELYDLELQVVAEMRVKDRPNDSWRYQGMAVVRRATINGLQDLRGAKSCHTGYARTAGWNIPFSQLLDKGLVKPKCSVESPLVESDLRAIASFFGPSCVPGPWTPDNKTDNTLKSKFSNLCALCGLPNECDAQDPHAGYEGALTCLVDGQGDVAWTKMSAVEEYFKGRSEVALSDYGLLCPDGRVVDVDPSVKQCNWASRPWNGWLVRSNNENKKAVVSALTTIVNAASPPLERKSQPWSKGVLGVTKPSVIHVRSPPVSTRDYLREHKYDTSIDHLGCPGNPVKLCVESRFSLEKCQALREVMWSRRIRPRLECVTPTTTRDCISMVGSSQAQITTADGGDIYRGHIEHKLQPIISEKYGLQQASYFAVAVVHAQSGINSLSQLRGKKSCHTGIGRTAGWKIPVVTLLQAGLLKTTSCDFAAQMSNFFSSLCVPGAKDPTYDPEGTNPQSLCDLCVGNNVNGASGRDEGKCDRGPIEAFSGYTGAFRCLVEGGGDVAFIKHTTVRENTNGNNNASWAANLRASDFKLLCRNQGSADVFDYNTCHLARVPAHKVLIDRQLRDSLKEEVRIMLLKASDWFPKGQDVFRMFGPFKGKHDLIFKDSATELVPVYLDTFHASLDTTYYETLRRIDSCKLEGIPLQLTDGATTLFFTPTYLMLCVVLAWLVAH